MTDVLPRRKPNRLSVSSYCGARSYFVTICCRERRAFFAHTELVRELARALQNTCAKDCFDIHAYCFMPDHFHVLLIGNGPTADLLRAVRNFKGTAAASARRLGIPALWQKGFYDHVIRTEESLNCVAGYILMNPVRAGFVKNAAEWPFSFWTVENWKTKEIPAEPYLPRWKKSV